MSISLIWKSCWRDGFKSALSSISSIWRWAGGVGWDRSESVWFGRRALLLHIFNSQFRPLLFSCIFNFPTFSSTTIRLSPDSISIACITCKLYFNWQGITIIDLIEGHCPGQDPLLEGCLLNSAVEKFWDKVCAVTSTLKRVTSDPSLSSGDIAVNFIWPPLVYWIKPFYKLDKVTVGIKPVGINL